MAATYFRRAVYRTAALAAFGASLVGAAGAAEPWDSDPAVQEVLELRRQGIAAMTSGGPTAESERYSSTFVANTPGNVVVAGGEMLARFAAGAISYQSVEQKLDYAASHGPDIVVLMGEETWYRVRMRAMRASGSGGASRTFFERRTASGATICGMRT
jgi:hypothetical protein